ncbi:hypothetical protein GCM10007898_30480 [Dyella flagellata]|uniref:Uncharacterized protein n=1 Tax=Dyella flagellata TaxID=1867833 RepID=A0ABQ5XG18_9GAMM|nr:hypothetical protein GCM10007898_30480 [Dyella flagellata]
MFRYAVSSVILCAWALAFMFIEIISIENANRDINIDDLLCFSCVIFMPFRGGLAYEADFYNFDDLPFFMTS